MDSQSNTPEEQAKDLLSKMRTGGIWEPEGLGLTLMKTKEGSVDLITQENTPFSAQARIRLRLLLGDIGWEMNEDECQLIDVQSTDPFTRHMENTVKRQEMAQNNWTCVKEGCGCMMSAFPLEEGRWEFLGQEEMETPMGTIEEVEMWSVAVKCPVCDTEVMMEPYDYGLLAGDDLMLSYHTAKVTYTALEREEVIRCMDANLDNVIVTGTFCPFTREMLPPHVRGAVVMVKEREKNEDIEEE